MIEFISIAPFHRPYYTGFFLKSINFSHYKAAYININHYSTENHKSQELYFYQYGNRLKNAYKYLPVLGYHMYVRRYKYNKRPMQYSWETAARAEPLPYNYRSDVYV